MQYQKWNCNSQRWNLTVKVELKNEITKVKDEITTVKAIRPLTDEDNQTS